MSRFKSETWPPPERSRHQPLGPATAPGNSRSQASESWAQQEAADQADEIRLKNKLRICSNCMTAPARDDAIDSMTRR